MKTIVLSGFCKFGNYPANSSKQICERMHHRNINGYSIQTMTFEANIPDYDRARMLVDLAKEVDARGIICLGMSSAILRPRIEFVAYNLVDCEKYCPPKQNGKRIRLLRARNERLIIPLQRWRLETFFMKSRIRVEHSENPDRFCCNHLMYQMALRQNADKPGFIPWIFIHVPCGSDCVPEPKDEFFAAGKKTMPYSYMIETLAFLIGNAGL